MSEDGVWPNTLEMFEMSSNSSVGDNGYYCRSGVTPTTAQTSLVLCQNRFEVIGISTPKGLTADAVIPGGSPR